MKRHVTLIGALLLVWMTSGMLQAMPRSQSLLQGQQATGELLVKFAREAGRPEREAAAKSIGGQLKERIDGLDIEVVTVPKPGGGKDIQGAAQMVGALEHNPLVEYVQPNYLYTTSDVGPRKVHLPVVLAGLLFTPNDPSLGLQYGWTKISAFEGWSHDRGSSKIVVAVVDTGIQLDHPDLSSKIVAGYDFVDGDTNATDALNGHGTHVAGTVGAVTDNAIGVAGACPNCMLMPIRVLDGSGNGYTSDVADGIVYAVNNGAKVINLSLGGNNADEVLKAAVDYAWSKGAFVACAAGNQGDNGNPINYPAYYDSCLAVGAVDRHDAHASYSEYGTWVDIAAPGSGVYSTYKNGGYASISGTSMATPHVAGVAGILAGQGLTNQQIRDRLLSKADQIDGTGTWWSNGRLNLSRAVRNW